MRTDHQNKNSEKVGFFFFRSVDVKSLSQWAIQGKEGEDLLVKKKGRRLLLGRLAVWLFGFRINTIVG